MRSVMMLVISGLLLTSCGQADFMSQASIVSLSTGIKSSPDQSGRVYYQSYRSQDGEPKAQRYCLLMHGYGLADEVWNSSFTKIKRAERVAATFAKTYFSKQLVRELLETSCEEVVVTMTDTANSTLEHLADRLEALLLHLECGSESAPRCSILAHSMGGAAAFLMMERCAERDSSLGEEGCQSLRRVFTAASPIMGSGHAFVITGAQIASEHHLLGYVAFGLNILQKLSNVLSRYFSSIGFDPASYLVNVTGEYIPGKQYPAWRTFDPFLSVGLESQKLDDCAEDSCGWLAGDFRYAANGGTVSLEDLRPKNICRNWRAGQIPNLMKMAGCRKMIHLKKRVTWSEKSLRRSYDLGARYLYPTPSQHKAIPNDFHDIHNLSTYKDSDAIVEATSALYRCHKFQEQNLYFVDRDSCVLFKETIHPALAGWTEDVRRHMIVSFK